MGTDSGGNGDFDAANLDVREDLFEGTRFPKVPVAFVEGSGWVGETVGPFRELLRRRDTARNQEEWQLATDEMRRLSYPEAVEA